jgi:hypothetical protein
MPRPAPEGEIRINVFGKPLRGQPKFLSGEEIADKEAAFEFPYLRDQAAERQNPGCAKADAEACATSFDTTSSTQDLVFTQAGAPNQFMPFRRAPTPVIVSFTPDPSPYTAYTNS